MDKKLSEMTAGDVKDAVVKKADEAKSIVKETAKKTVATATKKAKEAKDTVKKTATRTASKAADKVNETLEGQKADVFIQYAGGEVAAKDVLARVKEAYVSDGHKLTDIKSVQVYIKPEENAAFYVINKKAAGQVVLFS